MPMSNKNEDASTYSALGVSAGKEQVHRAVKAIPQSIFPGAFCRVLPDLFGGDPAKCVISHSDSAGTKSVVGYLAWREWNDPSALAGLATDATVMNLDDMACTGSRGPYVISNTITRNLHLVGEEAIKAIIEGYLSFASRMERYGVKIEIAGGETEDLGDITRTLSVGATMTALCRRDEVVDNANIRPGDVIVGFSNTGRAIYEDAENSSIGSNGLTLARHRLLSNSYLDKYPEISDPALPRNVVYVGPYMLDDPVPGSSLNVGRSLLSPTRTYAPAILAMLSELGAEIHGLVHCTGGGQAKCMSFGHGIHYVKTDLFPVPPLFELVRTSCEPHLPWREMYRVFNMGHRLEAFMPLKAAERAIAIAAEFGIEAKVVGLCESSPSGNRVTLWTPEGEEEYG